MSATNSAAAAASPYQAAFNLPPNVLPAASTTSSGPASAAATTAASNTVATAALTPIASAAPQPIASACPQYTPATSATLLSATTALSTAAAAPVNFASASFTQYRDPQTNSAPQKSIASASGATATAAAETNARRHRQVEDDADETEASRYGKKMKRAVGESLSSIQTLLAAAPSADAMASFVQLIQSMEQAESPASVMFHLANYIKEPSVAKMPEALAMLTAAYNALPAILRANEIFISEIAAAAKEAVATSLADSISDISITKKPLEAPSYNNKLHSDTAALRSKLQKYAATAVEGGKIHLAAMTELTKIWKCYTTFVHKVFAYVSESSTFTAAATKTSAQITNAAMGEAYSSTVLFNAASKIHGTSFDALMNANAIIAALEAFPVAQYGSNLKVAHQSVSVLALPLIAAAKRAESEALRIKEANAKQAHQKTVAANLFGIESLKPILAPFGINVQATPIPKTNAEWLTAVGFKQVSISSEIVTYHLVVKSKDAVANDKVQVLINTLRKLAPWDIEIPYGIRESSLSGGGYEYKVSAGVRIDEVSASISYDNGVEAITGAGFSGSNTAAAKK